MKAWVEKGAYINKHTVKYLSQHNPNDIKKILVIRQCAFGDVMATRPFLVELRRYFPNAHITYSTVPKYQYALPIDLVDSIHILNTKQSILKQIKEIRALPAYDILFDCANTSRSRILTYFSKANLKIGFPYKQIFNHLLFDIGILRSDFHYEAEIMLDMLKIMGHSATYPLDFALKKNDKPQTHKVIGYFPYASTEGKMLPKEQWKEMISDSAKQHPDFSHVILCGNGEHESNEYFMDITQSHSNIQLMPKLDLDALTTTLSEMSLLVVCDTGVRNLALATHTPTLGIFYSTVPFRYLPLYENRHFAVFNHDGKIPSTTQICAKIHQILTNMDH